MTTATDAVRAPQATDRRTQLEQEQSIRNRLSGGRLVTPGTATNEVTADPFAEIFARIASADPPAAPDPDPVETPVEPVESELATETEDESVESEAEESVAASGSIDESDVVVVDAVDEGPVDEIEVSLSDESAPESEAATTDPSSLEVEPVSIEQTNDQPQRDVEADTGPEPEQIVVTETPSDTKTETLPLNANQTGRQKQNDALETEVAELGETATEPLVKQSAPTSGETSTGKDSDPKFPNRDTDPIQQTRVKRRRYSKGQDDPHHQPAAAAESSPRSQQPRSTSAPTKLPSTDAFITEATPAPAASPSTSTNATAPSVSATPAAIKAITTAASSASSGSTTTDARPTDISTSLGAKTGAAPKKAANGKGADQLSAVQRAKMVQRVSRSFQHLGREGGQVRLRLSPEQLGSIQLDVQIQDGTMRGRLVAESEAAGQVIREHLADLRGNLESQGIRLESIEIEVDQTGRFEQSPQWDDSRPSSDSDKPPRRVPRREPAIGESNDSKPEPTSSVIASSSGGVDLRL